MMQLTDSEACRPLWINPFHVSILEAALGERGVPTEGTTITLMGNARVAVTESPDYIMGAMQHYKDTELIHNVQLRQAEHAKVS